MHKALQHLRAADPVLAAIIDRTGPYVIEYREPGFQTLVRSIVYQQLSGRVALTIFNRLAGALPGGAFTPEGVLSLTVEEMRALGLSGQKTAYIRDLAERTRSGAVDFGRLANLSEDEVIEHLTKVKGIGVWTSHMFLIFALRRPNVLPVGDLGVRMAMKKAYRLRNLPKPKQMERIARKWHPYCSVAAWYLWRSLENQGAV